MLRIISVLFLCLAALTSIPNLSLADKITISNGYLNLPVGGGIVFPGGSILSDSAGITGPMGPMGPPGISGIDGLNSLILPVDEASGANCTNGGVKIQVGLDQNRNGLLDAGEVTQTKYVCHGYSAYDISGTITSGGLGLSGVTVTLIGGMSVTTDASGNYKFSGLANGSYTITLNKSGYTFNPISSTKTVINANITGVNFAATASPSIIGTWYQKAIIGISSDQTFTVTATNWVNNDTANGGCIEGGTYLNNNNTITGTYNSAGGCHNEVAYSTVIINYTVTATTLVFFDKGSPIANYVRLY